MNDDDFLTFEYLPEPEQQGVAEIYFEEDKGFGIRTVPGMEPEMLAMVLTGIANKLLEMDLNGRNARTHRFFGR